jgi:hypothetical protein
MSLQDNVLQAIANAAIAGAVVGALRGQESELSKARRLGLQIGKTGQFNSLDDLMEYSRDMSSPIYHNYAGTSALDWLKTAAGIGALSVTGRPILTVAGGMYLADKQREKDIRSRVFKDSFVSNLGKPSNYE